MWVLMRWQDQVDRPAVLLRARCRSWTMMLRLQNLRNSSPAPEDLGRDLARQPLPCRTNQTMKIPQELKRDEPDGAMLRLRNPDAKMTASSSSTTTLLPRLNVVLEPLESQPASTVNATSCVHNVVTPSRMLRLRFLHSRTLCVTFEKPSSMDCSAEPALYLLLILLPLRLLRRH